MSFIIQSYDVILCFKKPNYDVFMYNVYLILPLDSNKNG